MTPGKPPPHPSLSLWGKSSCRSGNAETPLGWRWWTGQAQGCPSQGGVQRSPLPTDPLPPAWPQQRGHEHRWQRCPCPVSGLPVGWGKPPAPHPLCSRSSGGSRPGSRPGADLLVLPAVASSVRLRWHPPRRCSVPWPCTASPSRHPTVTAARERAAEPPGHSGLCVCPVLEGQVWVMIPPALLPRGPAEGGTSPWGEAAVMPRELPPAIPAGSGDVNRQPAQEADPQRLPGKCQHFPLQRPAQIRSRWCKSQPFPGAASGASLGHLMAQPATSATSRAPAPGPARGHRHSARPRHGRPSSDGGN